MYPQKKAECDIHSTDTHGFSEVIFGITHLLGFSFAPRIKNSSIVHWSHINFYGTYDFTKIDKKVLSMIS